MVFFLLFFFLYIESLMTLSILTVFFPFSTQKFIKYHFIFTLPLSLPAHNISIAFEFYYSQKIQYVLFICCLGVNQFEKCAIQRNIRQNKQYVRFILLFLCNFCLPIHFFFRLQSNIR